MKEFQDDKAKPLETEKDGNVYYTQDLAHDEQQEVYNKIVKMASTQVFHRNTAFARLMMREGWMDYKEAQLWKELDSVWVVCIRPNSEERGGIPSDSTYYAKNREPWTQ